MSDAKKGFALNIREDRIIKITLHSFARRDVKSWMDYVQEHDGKLKPPVRMLYDFRDAGLPSQYILDTITPFMQTLNIPEDTRNAYIFPSEYARFSMSFIRRMPSEAGLVRVFSNEESAVEWLLSEHTE